MLRTRLGSFVLAAGLSSFAFGQPPAVLVPAATDAAAGSPPASAAAMAPSGERAPQGDGAPAANKLSQKRLEKIRQLSFDRRPSSILKAQVEPLELEEIEDESSAPTGDTMPEAAKPQQTPPESSDDAAGNAAASQDNGAKAPAKSDDGATPETDKVAAQRAAEEKARQAEAVRQQREQAKAEKQFDNALRIFQRDVTLGNWDKVKAFLDELKIEEANELYGRLLESLRTGHAQGSSNPNTPQPMPIDAVLQPGVLQLSSSAGQQPASAFAEKNVFAAADIAGLVRATPRRLDDTTLAKLGAILRQSLSGGNDVGAIVALLEAGAAEPKQPILSQRELARLLFAAGEEIRAGAFLPELVAARRDSDIQGLNLITRYLLARHAKDGKAEQLEQAWEAIQSALGIDSPPAGFGKNADEPPLRQADIPPAAAANDPETTARQAKAKEKEQEKQRATAFKKEKDEALRRAVELAPRIREELGKRWLDESFTSHSTRGREILSTIGSLVSTNLLSHPSDADFRLKSLELEHTAVESLLRAAPQTATEWKDTLTLLAIGWLKEAQASRQLDNNSANTFGWQRDRYGNYFFLDEQAQAAAARNQGGNPRPIKIDDLLEVRPNDAWLALIHGELLPNFHQTFAQLYLKVEEEEKAFPHIEALARTNRIQAHDLAEEFVRVWTSHHNPNENRDRDPFMYYWGWEQRADRIPLTRSKQERNLRELAEWVKRLRALPVDPVEETLLTQAFTTAHSKAEVYRLEAIESVFGSMEQLKPRTLAELIQQMRGNLATVWQLPDVQKQNSTNRKQRDIQVEVLRGYDVARQVVKMGLEKHHDHWALVLADAAVMHDENDFRGELEKSSEFAPRRLDALNRFRRAAELYAQQVDQLKEEEQTPLVYEQWFYAGLGAVDLGRIKPEHVSDPRQPALIRQAMAALPGEAAERHRAQFANHLFTRTGNAKSELKYRYLKGGFEIVGDHKLAREARKLLDYYDDLVTEIKLEARIDGADAVGHGHPFGVFVNLVHTKDIERESGGFGRYLQNQNTNQYYFYNFGRPLENYRDKFQKTVSEALGEHFEILSVTFQDPKVHSKALPEYGWRVTPYAYLLLKAKGPEVDKITPLRLDLDFLDTSGYAILPVESPAVPLDAKTDKPPARPVEEIVITQTLDERQSNEGKLKLEVRATGRGLLPALDEIVALKPAGFEVAEIEDGGVSVTEFAKEADETSVLSERLWNVTFRAGAGQPAPPTRFQFGTVKVPVKEAVFQRYQDADLVSVGSEIDLQERYGQRRYARLWPILPVAVAAVLVVLAVVRLARRGRRPVETRFRIPDPLTPFTLLGLLRDIEHNNGLSESARSNLAADINRLETHYFIEPGPQEPNLREIAEAWVAGAVSTSSSA